MQSARIHDLRVMLMVNALKCRTRHPQTLRSYGNLLDERGQEFADHNRQVLSAMIDRYGPLQGPGAYNRYETALANYHSMPEPSQRQCEDVAAYISLAARADHAELATLSKLATNRSIDACLTPLNGADDDELAKLDPSPEPAMLTQAAAAEGAPEMVDGIPTYHVPGTGPDTAPEPLEKVALPAFETTDVEPEKPQPAQASAAEDKLDQAILALSEAVAALSDLRREP
ncbi:hypothetical protein J3454_12005 [Erythrobacter sp. NFXS35]|uniref:hypothetical protein n=1 Tax=Erythrobacter sp. NFXS35 TaxID=2818436 RepID=UPI0032DF41F5